MPTKEEDFKIKMRIKNNVPTVSKNAAKTNQHSSEPQHEKTENDVEGPVFTGSHWRSDQDKEQTSLV